MIDLVRGFSDRTDDARTLVETLVQELWEGLKERLIHVEYGYETHIPPEVREKMRYVYTTTTRYVRFAPDFFVLDVLHPENLYLLEYKCTRTPLYSQWRITELKEKANQMGWPGLDRLDIGQWEAAAYDNYKALGGVGIRVAVLNYCAYHSRPLLCDFIDRVRVLGYWDVTTSTTRGSKTPFVNLDLRGMRPLSTFLAQEHRGNEEWTGKIAGLTERALQELSRVLPPEEHPKSPWRKSVD